MKMRHLALSAAVALCACGGDDEPAGDQERLQGQWGVEIGAECLQSVAFAGDEIEVDLICNLEGGGIGVQAVVGTYEINESASTFTWRVIRSSCSRSALPFTTETVSYSFEGDALRFVTPEQVSLLERAPESSGGSVQGTFGCFDAQGMFRPQAVSPI